jgi:hypothetical protein
MTLPIYSLLTIHEYNALSNSDSSISSKGSFNNYVDKKRGEGVSRKSMLCHVTKGRYHVKCPQLSTRGERVSKFGPRSY